MSRPATKANGKGKRIEEDKARDPGLREEVKEGRAE